MTENITILEVRDDIVIYVNEDYGTTEVLTLEEFVDTFGFNPKETN